MPCRIKLRHDQHSSLIPTCQQIGITIYAPEWVRAGLTILSTKLQGITFNVEDNIQIQSQKKEQEALIDSFTISDDHELTLVTLQKVARNESRNVSGVIQKSYYQPDVSDVRIIYALKDLVRQCVMIGLDETSHYGGYPAQSRRIVQKIPVVIVDLIGLQFQQPWNTGRLVLCSKSNEHVGALDELIFESVVGESKKSFEEIEEAGSASAFGKRYIVVGALRRSYFDVYAYKKFVAGDVILSILGLSQTVQVESPEKQVHFKFLKYGAGYFAGSDCGQCIQAHILSGVIDGLEEVFAKHSPLLLPIKSFEFPFFQANLDETERLHSLCSKYSVQVKFSRDDALQMTAPSPEYLIATTNCADPHAATGNEMGFGSVDSVIAENLKSKANVFNPLLNSRIQSAFIQM